MTRPWYGPSRAVQSHRVDTARLFTRSTVPQSGHCTPLHTQYSPTGWALHASSRVVQSHRVGTARLFTRSVQSHRVGTARLFTRSTVPQSGHWTPLHAQYSPTGWALHASSRAVQSHRVGTARLLTVTAPLPLGASQATRALHRPLGLFSDKTMVWSFTRSDSPTRWALHASLLNNVIEPVCFHRKHAYAMKRIPPPTLCNTGEQFTLVMKRWMSTSILPAHTSCYDFHSLKKHL